VSGRAGPGRAGPGQDGWGTSATWLAVTGRASGHGPRTSSHGPRFWSRGRLVPGRRSRRWPRCTPDGPCPSHPLPRPSIPIRRVLQRPRLHRGHRRKPFEPHPSRALGALPPPFPTPRTSDAAHQHCTGDCNTSIAPATAASAVAFYDALAPLKRPTALLLVRRKDFFSSNAS
jgi:hypothetical protein